MHETHGLNNAKKDPVMMKILVAIGLAFIVTWIILPSNAEAARWKMGSGGCYWDEYDDGPDQCSPGDPPPASGRYKTDGMSCWWDANDSGPDQCDPSVPVGQP